MDKGFISNSSQNPKSKGSDFERDSTTKQEALNLYKSGTSVAEIATSLSISRSILYKWIKENNNISPNSTKSVYQLENKVKRLEGIIEILQSVNCTVSSPLNEKLDALEQLYGKYSVHMLCDALKVPRGTFYNFILRNKRDNTLYSKRQEELRIKIQEIYDENKLIFGAAKIAAVLKEQGYRTSDKTVRNLMRDMGLISIRQDAKSIYDKEQRKIKNHLNQQFNVSNPNEVWVSDVTYFRWNNKNIYICAVIDLYARMVVGYKIGLKNSTQLVKSTFKASYELRNPKEGLIFHTDRGSNYRSKSFGSYVESLGVIQSFSRAHLPYDNSVMESFFSSLKREELYRTKYRSEKELRTGIENYMIFYNEKRPHAQNGYKTPLKKENEYHKRQK